MDDKLRLEIIKSISLQGGIDSITEKPIINGNTGHVLSKSSGLVRIKHGDKFGLILSLPLSLSALNPFEIRCVICNKIISYPAWYYHVSYLVNSFHYFVCFDPASPLKPTIKCIRR
jgi:hypothetical protein